MRRIRILIADGHPLARMGINTLLSNEPDLEVVGEVAHGAEVELAIARLAPDVLLLEVNVPGLDAATVTRHLTGRYPELEVLILTGCDEERLILDLLRAGATGYALKEEAPENLLFAIRAAARGQTWLSSRVARILVRKAAVVPGSPAASRGLSGLTAREREVLALVGQGLSNKEIAEALFISSGTVRSHINHIYGKTGLRTRAQAVRYAMEQGLVSGSEQGVSRVAARYARDSSIVRLVEEAEIFLDT